MAENHEIRDFSSDVIDRSRSVPVLVDFWAEWCGPCKVLGPTLERLEQKSGGRWVLAKVDTDRHQDLAQQYGVRGIPNVKLFLDGRVANEFTGAMPEHAVERWLERVLPNRFQKEIEEAERLVHAGKGTEARRLLEDLLAREPGELHARVLLAKLLLPSDRVKARDLVEGIEEDSPLFPGADAVRTIAALRGKLEHPESLPAGPGREVYLAAITDLTKEDYRGALEKFIEVIRNDRHFDEDGSRKACIAIFRLLGEEHDVTRSYRREFGSALNV